RLGARVLERDRGGVEASALLDERLDISAWLGRGRLLGRSRRGRLRHGVKLLEERAVLRPEVLRREAARRDRSLAGLACLVCGDFGILTGVGLLAALDRLRVCGQTRLHELVDVARGLGLRRRLRVLAR